MPTLYLFIAVNNYTTGPCYRLFSLADRWALATMGLVFMTSTLTQDLAQLHEMLSRKSVQFGNFTLASGQTSDVYVDCKPTTCDPRAMRMIGRLFLRKMAEKMWLPEAVGGL